MTAGWLVMGLLGSWGCSWGAAWAPGTAQPGAAPEDAGGWAHGLSWLLSGILPENQAGPWVRAAAVLLVGAAVKLMDDVLDRDEDALLDRPNWAERWGPGATAYALAGLLVAAALSLRDAFGLFWACYAWGMAHGAKERLPSGLRAWQESALAVGLAVVGTGAGEAVAALALVGSIQLADDWWDLRSDTPVPAGPSPHRAPSGSLQHPPGFPDGPGAGHPPPRNWAARLGRTETALAAGALGLAALAHDPWRALSTWLSAAVITAATARWASRPNDRHHPGGGHGALPPGNRRGAEAGPADNPPRAGDGSKAGLPGEGVENVHADGAPCARNEGGPPR